MLKFAGKNVIMLKTGDAMRKLIILLLVFLLFACAVSAEWWDAQWSSRKCYSFDTTSRVNELIRYNLSELCVEGVGCKANFSDVRVIIDNQSLQYQLVNKSYDPSPPYQWLYFVAPYSNSEVCFYTSNPAASSVKNQSMLLLIDEFDQYDYYNVTSLSHWQPRGSGLIAMEDGYVSYFTPHSSGVSYARVVSGDGYGGGNRPITDVLSYSLFSPPFYYYYKMNIVSQTATGCPFNPFGCHDSLKVDWNKGLDDAAGWGVSHGLEIDMNVVNSDALYYRGNLNNATSKYPSYDSAFAMKTYITENYTYFKALDSGDGLINETTTYSDLLWSDPTPIRLSSFVAALDFDYFYVSNMDFNVYYNQNILQEIVSNCTPDWWCSEYNCTVDDESRCVQVSDYYSCDEPYHGDFSEFNVTYCDYCTPAFYCSAYNETCDSLKSRECFSVNDTNNCYYQTYLPSDAFTGNESDFDIPCGYQPRYSKSDLLPIGKDAFGGSIYSILLVLGAIIAILILVLFVNMLTKRGVRI